VFSLPFPFKTAIRWMPVSDEVKTIRAYQFSRNKVEVIFASVDKVSVSIPSFARHLNCQWCRRKRPRAP
jgi:hypothetical protein